MSSATANRWDKVAAWALEKSAGTLPEVSDAGKPATEGARGSENASDVKKVVGGDSVEGGPTNPRNGKADNQAGYTGLKQTTVGKMSDVERAVKVVECESEKASAADTSNATELDAAFLAIQKAAAELPTILAYAGVPSSPSQPQASAPSPADGRPISQLDKAAADRALAATVDSYRKYGSDRADAALQYLRGYWDTMNHLVKAAEDGTLEQLMAASQAGGGGGGEMPPGGGEDVPVPGPAPAPGGEGPPAGPEAGEPGTDDQAAALAELGITPQELEQLLAILHSKAQSEPMSPETKEAVSRVLTKAAHVASEVKHRVRSGAFQFKPAADGSPERARRNAARTYFEELQRAAR